MIIIGIDSTSSSTLLEVTVSNCKHNGQRADVSYCDPHVPSLPKMRHYDLPAMTTAQPTPEYYASLDCVLISTDHSLFNWDEIVEHATLVVDTRNATKNVTSGREKIFKA